MIHVGVAQATIDGGFAVHDTNKATLEERLVMAGDGVLEDLAVARDRVLGVESIAAIDRAVRAVKS